MNYNYDFKAINIKDFNAQNVQKPRIIFSLLILNTLLVLIILATVLYPPKAYKKIIVHFFSSQITLNKFKLKIYHILLLIIGFYIFIYFYLKIFIEQQYNRKETETYTQRMIRLDKKWVIESEIWMIFLIIICLISIYRNAHLFNKEIRLDEKIKEIKEKIKKNESNNKVNN